MIANCPFTNDQNDGAEHNITVERDMATGRFYVACVTCCYQGGQHNTKELAIDRHNALCARLEQALTLEHENRKLSGMLKNKITFKEIRAAAKYHGKTVCDKNTLDEMRKELSSVLELKAQNAALTAENERLWKTVQEPIFSQEHN